MNLIKRFFNITLLCTFFFIVHQNATYGTPQVDKLLNEGEKLVNQKKYSAAETKVAQAIKLDPLSAKGYYLLGKIYQDGYKDYGKAIKYYKKSIQFSPENEDNHYNTGSCYYALGKKDNAIAWLDYTKELVWEKKLYKKYEKVLGVLIKIVEDKQLKIAYQKELDAYKKGRRNETTVSINVPQITIEVKKEHRIAFYSNRDVNGEIYLMNSDGNNQACISKNSANDSIPSWSPDGKKITFTSYRDGNGEIYVMNSDGNGQVNLTNNLSEDIFSCWSPDGRKIAFTSSRDGNYEIYVMNADGTSPVNLTASSGQDQKPSWSPDGRKIIFTSDRDGDYEIFIMNSDGSQQVNLTDNLCSDIDPSWSPDGRKIAFTSNRDGNNEVYIMNSDGSEQINLTASSSDDESPSWESGSRKIYFTSNRDGNHEVYVININGTDAINLTNNQAEDGWPSQGR